MRRWVFGRDTGEEGATIPWFLPTTTSDNRTTVFRNGGPERLVRIVGISGTNLGRVFERFFVADRSRATGGGTGLGLSIAKHIVEQHGGEISVQSALGEGSTFTVSLPNN